LALVGIEAADADVALTLRLAPGRVHVANGIVGRPQVVVRAASETLTDLASVPLLTHPDVVSRLNRLLSVR
jgi:hypothetical protein